MSQTLLSAVLLLFLASIGTAADAQTFINGAGATFPYPVYSKWFDEYNKLHPDVQINYQSIGSGGGIRQVGELTVDFGATDSPMTDEQLEKAKTKLLHFPTVLGAVVPTYNIPGLTGELRFTGEILSGILLGEIKRWNDPGIAKVNPGIKLPTENIVVAHRSDGSGTTYVWTDYLSKLLQTHVHYQLIFLLAFHALLCISQVSQSYSLLSANQISLHLNNRESNHLLQ